MRGDSGVQDVVGTVLLVALTVVLGCALAVVVTSTFGETVPTDASLALAPVTPGATTATLRLANGEPIPLSTLRVTLARDAGAAADVPRASWTTADATTLRPGDALSFPLSPAAGTGETLRVRVYRTDANALLAEFAARAGGATSTSPAASLTAAVTPSSLPADSETTGLLTVRVSTTAGALGVASVTVNMTNVSNAAGSGPLSVALSDDGAGGDAQGGDGTWSGLVVLPRSTPLGTYAVSISALDPSGFVVGSTTGSVTAVIPTPSGNFTGNFSGNLTGVRGFGPMRMTEGASFGVPSSANVTTLRLRNWTWDALHVTRLANDAMTIRVLGTGGWWAATMTFDSCTGGVACLKTLTTWNAANETAYVPRNATLPLAGLDLNLLDPVGSLQMVRSSGSAHPNALYAASAVGSDATFFVVQMRDDRTSAAADAGLFSVDLGVSP